MNKLDGFYKLRELSIPTVKWQQYHPDVQFDSEHLWTIRVAVARGSDFDLPRAVGVDSATAKQKANELYSRYSDIGIVIYYPYFVAIKSGIAEVRNRQMIIEAVEKDLWNLATDGRRDETIIIADKVERHGRQGFVTEEELEEIRENLQRVRARLRDHLHEGKSILLEWSFAQEVDSASTSIGDPYLVFYECKAV